MVRTEDHGLGRIPLGVENRPRAIPRLRRKYPEAYRAFETEAMDGEGRDQRKMRRVGTSSPPIEQMTGAAQFRAEDKHLKALRR